MVMTHPHFGASNTDSAAAVNYGARIGRLGGAFLSEREQNAEASVRASSADSFQSSGFYARAAGFRLINHSS